MAQIAVGYIRVSSEQQAGEKQTSLGDQRAAIVALAERLGVPVVETFEDAGLSGATVAKRPGLKALLAYCQQHKRTDGAGLVLVLNDSRFGRFDDPDEAAALRFQLKQRGWIVRFAEADDIQDPSLRHIMRAVGGAQASEYRRNLRANSTRGRHGTVRQGYWASREPFGYRRQVIYPVAQQRVLEKGQAKARGEKITLLVHEAEAAIVREIFRRYVSGAYSMKALCRWLNTEPVATLGRQAWAGTTVRGVLENMTYLGLIAARRRTAERMERGDYGRGVAEYVVQGLHPALIDRDTFDLAQQQLLQVPVQAGAYDYRVRGLIRCDTCGELFMGGGLGSKLRSTGQHSRFYICQGGREKRCPPRAACITTHLLEGAVIHEVAAHVAREIAPATIRRQFAARLEASMPKATDHTKARQRIAAKRQRLIGAIESGAFSIDEVQPRLDALRAEAESLTDAPSAPDPAALRQHLDRLVARGRDLVALADAATGPELRALLRPWVDTMTFEKSTRTLTLRLRKLSASLLAQNPQAETSPEQIKERRVVVGGRRA